MEMIWLFSGPENASTNAAALNAALAGPGGQLPSGEYQYDATLIPSSGVVLTAAARGGTTLVYTGNGHGVAARAPGGVYRAGLAGITFRFGGSGNGHGFYADAWRYSWMRDCRFVGWPGDGIHLDGDGVTSGCWSNRFTDVECDRNGGHGWSIGSGGNAVYLAGCMGSVNGLDGFHLGKNARVTMTAPQAEANGRHAFACYGAQTVELIAPYAEHHRPSFWGFDDEIPGYAVSTERSIVHVTRAPDGTACGRVAVRGGHLEGGDGSATAGLFAEHAASVLWEPDTLANISGNRGTRVAATVRRFSTSRPVIPGVSDTDASSAYLNMAHDYARGGQTVARREPVGPGDGFTNLLVNGGFDAEPADTTGVPVGWTLGYSGAWTREAGSDGGQRLVGTNVLNRQCFVYQDVRGPEVRPGAMILTFTAIVPTSNTRNRAQVRVRCLNDQGQTVSGGGLESWFLSPDDAEVWYALPFPVPDGTTTVRVMLFTSDGGAANTDVLKVDRMALRAGDVATAWSARPLTEMGGRILAPVQIPTSAGAPSDALFPVAPQGACMAVYDTSNNRLYVRGADGLWRYAVLT